MYIKKGQLDLRNYHDDSMQEIDKWSRVGYWFVLFGFVFVGAIMLFAYTQ